MIGSDVVALACASRPLRRCTKPPRGAEALDHPRYCGARISENEEGVIPRKILKAYSRRFRGIRQQNRTTFVETCLFRLIGIRFGLVRWINFKQFYRSTLMIQVSQEWPFPIEDYLDKWKILSKKYWNNIDVKNSLGPGLNQGPSLFQRNELPVTPPRASAICFIDIGLTRPNGVKIQINLNLIRSCEIDKF